MNRNNPIRVFIVEDEPIIANTIERHLEFLGYRVRGIASDAEEAMDLLAREGADVVLMDIHIDGSIDGITLASQVQEEFRIPVVYLTGMMDDETLNRAKITQPFGYIAKPFTRRELQIALEIAVYKAETERILRDREMQIQELLDTMKQGFCLLDQSGHVIQENKMFRKLLGLTTADIYMHFLGDFFHPQDRRYIENCITDSSSFPKEPIRLRLLGADDREIAVLSEPRVIMDDWGMRGCFVSFTEILHGESGEL